MAKQPQPCPCGSGLSLTNCCQPLLQGMPAPTPEALMRSRYTAYTLRNVAYLQSSWHATTRPAELDLNDNPPTKWIGLEIKHSSETENVGEVEFIARYKVNGRAGKLHETSRFRKVDGYWQYIDGDMVE
ncbi:YchJ family metal-binding protein [Chitinivorax sp. B]|uniref:YchJ family protein n=1 Tax=Chitinivorax sp. B TaxID=2502235 RepID=UPI0010F9D55C|nr:YchJ family metal-binding protein [Chitinivorax sp. B]